MDTFDDFDDFDLPPTSNRSDVIWNILTSMVVLMILCIGTGFLTLLVNPQASWNPFPPPTLPPTLSYPTSTPTPRQLPTPIRTSTPTQPIPTKPSPTITSSPTNILPTNTPLLPTVETPTPTFTPTLPPTTENATATPATPQAMPFIIQPGNPVYIQSTTFHPNEGCNWLSVAGKALDLSGEPISGLVVKVTGTLNEENVELIGVTGTTALPPGAYSPADGYEIPLATTPIASEGTLFIQLLDNAGFELSNPAPFDTYDDCQRNLILINFKQIEE
jgi:cytoskeletal protein RodZ